MVFPFKLCFRFQKPNFHIKFWFIGFYINFQFFLKSIIWHKRIKLFFNFAFVRSYEVILRGAETEFYTHFKFCKDKGMKKNYQTYECQPEKAYVYVEVYTYNNFIQIYDVIIYGSECLLLSKEFWSTQIYHWNLEST